MTLLIILVLCSFRLVLAGKTGEEIPESSRLEFIEEFSANIFASWDAEDNTSGPLFRGGIPNVPSLRTLLAIRQEFRELSFWEVMHSFVLLAYSSLAASRTRLQRVLACLNFTLGSEDLFCWYKRKTWFLWTMAAAQAAENHGDDRGLVRYFRWGIYTSILTLTYSQDRFTNSSRSTEFKDILPWDIFEMITKIILSSTRIVLSNVMKLSIPLWIWWKVSGNWSNSMVRISQWRESQCRTITSIRGKEHIQKSRTVRWESQSGIRVGKITIWVRSFEIEKL